MSHLPVPVSILNAHSAILGKTGAGKSSLLRVVVEDLLRRGKRVCVIDPKGDWYGLKLSADGKSKGYPVITFGDFVEEKATDVPINEHSGRHVAELISSGNRPCVIGFRGWMPGRMTQFWIDFASTLFNSKSGELYLIVDEFHNFAPKGKVLDPQAGKSLHWANRLLSEGRGLGLIILIASQRPQKVHNDSLTCCETLFAMRVIHAADRGAIKDWIDGCADKAQGITVLNSLAAQSRGEATVWSPENNFGPKLVKFPMFETFDSFAPPQLQKKISAAGWAGVDLDAVKEKLAAVIEEAEANNPTALKRRIRDLESQVKTATAKPAGPPPEPTIKQVFVVRDEDVSHYEGLKQAYAEVMTKVARLTEQLMNASAAVEGTLAHLRTIKTANIAMTPTAPPRIVVSQRLNPKRFGEPLPPAVDNGDWKPSKCARAILSALLQIGKPVSKSRLALLSGYSVTSSTFDNGMSECRTNGALQGTGDSISATARASEVVPNWEPLPTGAAMRNYWINKVGANSCPGKLLAKLVEVYPDSMQREDLAAATDYSVTSSTFDNGLSTLRTLELITRDRDPSAHPDLFG